MKVLVTGGCGFIASHVVDAYIDKGYDVVIVDNLSSGKMENRNEKAKFYKVDICDALVVVVLLPPMLWTFILARGMTLLS